MKLFVPTLVALLAIAAAAPVDLSVVSRATTTLTKALDGNDVKVLKGILTKEKLVETISKLPAKTIFAPTDAAFEKSLKALGFDKATVDDPDRMVKLLDSLGKNSSAIDTGKILQYHVVNKSLSAEMLTTMGSVATLEGKNITVKKEGNKVMLTDLAPKVADATVTEADVKLEAGTLHKIDGMLLPLAVDPADKATADLVKKVAGEFPANKSDAVCFPASAIVRTVDGKDITMADLAAGHSIRIHETARFSKVFAFSHKQHAGLHEFVRVTAESGRSISLSPSHYMYANGKMVAARAVKVGDKLRTIDGPSVVKTVERVKDFGLVAPHTMHGDVVVNGIVASTYTTAVHPHLARFLLAPVRMVVNLGLSKEPLGTSLYEGAPRLQKIVPGGPDMF